MRTNFGFQKAIVLTDVNEYFYINLCNKSQKNPGRCSLSYSDFEELIRIKGVMDQLKPQMVEVSLFYLIWTTANDIKTIYKTFLSTFGIIC